MADGTVKHKLVNGSGLDPFWIARVGDWLYLFDYPDGRMLGGPIFCPARS